MHQWQKRHDIQQQKVSRPPWRYPEYATMYNVNNKILASITANCSKAFNKVYTDTIIIRCFTAQHHTCAITHDTFGINCTKFNIEVRLQSPTKWRRVPVFPVLYTQQSSMCDCYSMLICSNQINYTSCFYVLCTTPTSSRAVLACNNITSQHIITIQ